jgi:6-phosphogluconolactonase
MHGVPLPAAGLRVFPDVEAMSQAAAGEFVAAVRDAVDARGSATIALAGGDTPRRLYALLAMAPYRDRVAWPRLDVFFTDERQVSPGDPRSNVQMALEVLLDQVPVPPTQVHRPRMDDASLARAAADYAAEVSARVPPGAGGWPGFDLILLGMGADGHTASLFPGDPVLDNYDVTVAAVETPHAGFRRITLTLPVLNAARHVCFMVAGEGKAAAVARVCRDQDPSLPASRVRPALGSLAWLLDAAAARLLPGR